MFLPDLRDWEAHRDVQILSILWRSCEPCTKLSNASNLELVSIGQSENNYFIILCLLRGQFINDVTQIWTMSDWPPLAYVKSEWLLALSLHKEYHKSVKPTPLVSVIIHDWCLREQCYSSRLYYSWNSIFYLNSRKGTRQNLNLELRYANHRATLHWQ